MKLISIYKNGVELDYIQETLTIKKENNLLGEDIKFTHNSFPFLIIENENTERLLGSNHLLSVNKQYFDIDVITLDGKFKGELQVLEYTANYRKCNIRYNSKIYSLENLKIRELFPAISVIGEQPPRPYKKQNEGLFPPSIAEAWKVYVHSFDEKRFPEVHWQFPMIFYPDKFGELKEGDEWEKYNKHINTRFFLGGSPIDTNNAYDTPEGIDINNRNVVTPFVYLLSPLFLACQKAGLKMDEQITQDPFINSLLLYSSEDNLTDILTIGSPTFIPLFNQNVERSNIFPYSWSRSYTITLSPGVYIFSYEIEYANNRNYLRAVTPDKTENLFAKEVGSTSESFSGDFEVTITQQHVNQNKNTVWFNCQSSHQTAPVVRKFTYEKKLNRKGAMFHPTIEMARYIPDWTFGEYLEQLKRLFNLRFEEDYNGEVLKVVYQDKDIMTRDYYNLGSVFISGFTKLSHSNIELKYDNDVDEVLDVSADGFLSNTNQLNKDKVLTVENKFKQLNFHGSSIIIDQPSDKKSGVGLVLYQPNFYFETSKRIDGTQLDLWGIFERYYKNTSRIYLNPNRLEIELKITRFDLIEIEKKKRVLVNDLPYYVDQLSYSRKGSLIDVKLNLIPL